MSQSVARIGFSEVLGLSLIWEVFALANDMSKATLGGKSP